MEADAVKILRSSLAIFPSYVQANIFLFNDYTKFKGRILSGKGFAIGVIFGFRRHSERMERLKDLFKTKRYRKSHNDVVPMR